MGPSMPKQQVGIALYVLYIVLLVESPSTRDSADLDFVLTLPVTTRLSPTFYFLSTCKIQ